eukprot:GFUD01000630.1.p1 GENE.GFUD01000630.1~~GFUD01000630.1.p1  ORF type:complete len:348 (-),score=103.86 GFUD01000630.1:90-1133(-)
MSDNQDNFLVTLARAKPWFEGLFPSVASTAQITLMGGDQGDPVSIPAIVLVAVASKEIKSLLLATCLSCQSPVIVIPSATSSTLKLVRQVLCEGKVDPMTGLEISRRKLDVEAVLELLAPGVKLVNTIASAGVTSRQQDEGDVTITGVTKEEWLMSSEEEEGVGVKEEMSSKHEDVLELSTASSNCNDQIDMEGPEDEGADDESYQMLGRMQVNLTRYEDETVRVEEVDQDTNGGHSGGGGRAQAGGMTGHISSSKEGGKLWMMNDGDAIKKLEKVVVKNPKKVNRKKTVRNSRSKHSMKTRICTLNGKSTHCYIAHCDICDYKCSRPSRLRIHKRSKHGISDDISQ